MSAWTFEGIKLPGYEGRVAVVTGAARNIGRAIAEAMREQGSQVALLDMDWEGEEIPDDPGMLALDCDVADEAAVDAAISRVEETFGAPSILVNNAGILGPAGVPNTTLEDWQRVFDVNSTGAFLCIRRVLPAMREARYGRIINVGSNSGKMGSLSGVTAYAASKGAVHTLAKAVAPEVAKEGITVNALAPSMVHSRMTERPNMDQYAKLVLIGRMGTPSDVAYAALFLGSSAASFITAEVMDVNGGYYID